MLWLTPALGICATAALLVFTMAHSGQAQTTGTSTLQTAMQLNQTLMSLIPEPVLDPTTDPLGNFHTVTQVNSTQGTRTSFRAHG